MKVGVCHHIEVSLRRLRQSRIPTKWSIDAPVKFNAARSLPEGGANLEAEFIERTPGYESWENGVAVVVERVMGPSGILLPETSDYLPTRRRTCTDPGILLIPDEGISGFAQIGEWFAVKNRNVVADRVRVL